MQSSTFKLFNLLEVFLGITFLITPKAIANPTPTEILPNDPTVLGKSMENLPHHVANSDLREESHQVIPKVFVSQYAPIQSPSFIIGTSSFARDLLSDEDKARGFLTAQTDSVPSENPTTPEANPKESSAAESETELAKKAQNPIANLISVPFQNNTNFGVGSLDRTQNVLNIQPVIPISINKDWLLITRTILPLVYQPEPSQGGGGTFGLGDINPQFYFSPKNSSNVTWGVGPTFVLPTATNQVLGQGKWSIGPAAVIVVTTKRLVFGAVGNNVWSFAGDNSRPNVSQLTFQPFVNYNFDDGWYLVSSPIITSNWYAASGNQWTVPLGGGFGRVFAIGQQKVNTSIQAYWNVVKPEGGADWTLRVQFVLLFPN